MITRAVALSQTSDGLNMAVLNFTLSPEAVGKFNNALVCLGRFSDSVSIESNKDQVRSSILKWREFNIPANIIF